MAKKDEWTYDDGERLTPGDKDFDEVTDKEWTALERLEAERQRIAEIEDPEKRRQEEQKYQYIVTGAQAEQGLAVEGGDHNR
jgi:hypothetical protein